MTACSVTVNGRQVDAQLSGDGQTIHVPVGNGRTVSLPAKAGTYTLKNSAIKAEAEQEEAARLRRVREAAARKPLPSGHPDRASVRKMAQRVAAREHHAAVWSSGYEAGRSAAMKSALSDRLTDQDGEQLVELIMQRVLTDRELRRGYVRAAEVAELMDAEAEPVTEAAPVEQKPTILNRIPHYFEDDPNPFAAPAPAEPTLTAPVEDRPISELIAEIDSQVAHELVAPAQDTTAAEIAPQEPAQEPMSASVSEDGPARVDYSTEPKAAQNRLNSTLVFGMTSIAVGLCTMVSDQHGPETFSVHDADGGRIKWIKTCSTCGEVVTDDVMGRAHKGHDGAVLTMSAEEYASLDVANLRELTVSEFVDAGSVDVSLYRSHYVLKPGKSADKPYALLRDTLHAQAKMGLVRLVIRRVESLAVVRADGEHLVLSVLAWADQVRVRPEIAPVDYTSEEAARAAAIVEAMSTGKLDLAAHIDGRVSRTVALLEG